MYTMLTGTPHPTPKVDQTRAKPDDPPHIGSIHARTRGWRDGLPPFVTLPTLFQAPPVDGIWPGQSAAFLGRRYDPLVNKESAAFRLPDVELSKRACRWSPFTGLTRRRRAKGAASTIRTVSSTGICASGCCRRPTARCRPCLLI
jgi:hypothetical protein